MNILIVRAFIALRQFALQYKDLAYQIQEIRQTVDNHGEQLSKIYVAIETLLAAKETQQSWEDAYVCPADEATSGGLGERIGFK